MPLAPRLLVAVGDADAELPPYRQCIEAMVTLG
jgi:hypothetical protein